MLQAASRLSSDEQLVTCSVRLEAFVWPIKHNIDTERLILIKHSQLHSWLAQMYKLSSVIEQLSSDMNGK
jgi:hypothetical protein